MSTSHICNIFYNSKTNNVITTNSQLMDNEKHKVNHNHIVSFGSFWEKAEIWPKTISISSAGKLDIFFFQIWYFLRKSRKETRRFNTCLQNIRSVMKFTHKNWLNMRATGVTYICDTRLKWFKSHSSISKFRVAASIVLKKLIVILK